MSENRKDIEIINGDGSNLDISPVHDHLNSIKPKTTEKKSKDFIIPKNAKKIDNKKTK